MIYLLKSPKQQKLNDYVKSSQRTYNFEFVTKCSYLRWYFIFLAEDVATNVFSSLDHEKKVYFSVFITQA